MVAEPVRVSSGALLNAKRQVSDLAYSLSQSLAPASDETLTGSATHQPSLPARFAQNRPQAKKRQKFRAKLTQSY